MKQQLLNCQNQSGIRNLLKVCVLLLLWNGPGLTVYGQISETDALPLKTKTQKPAEEEKTVLYAAPSAVDLKVQLETWTAGQKAKDPALLKRVASLLAKLNPSLNAEDKLNLTMQVFAEVKPEAREVARAYQLSDQYPVFSNQPLLVEGKADQFYLANLRYYVARNLTQYRMVDQALVIFNTIHPDQLVDPAGYLFYKAVCEHHLLQKEACEKTLTQLLDRTQEIPERYRQLATLMQADLASLKEDSLDEISRKMSDVERRLDLGKSGKDTQKVEDEIIAALDKMIKKMEDQSKNSPSSGAGPSSSGSPEQGADESRVKGSTAPGEVDKKKLSNNGGWGTLPPKKQASAKNIINRNFPSHYRKAIEKYFKKLATEKASSGK